MKIYVAGNSHLTHYTKIGAAFRGLHVTNDDDEADLILIAQDAKTTDKGVRDLSEVKILVEGCCPIGKPVILMSQVPPRFCRRMGYSNLYHYPETLRIKDSYERACNPEYIIIGCDEAHTVDAHVMTYARAFCCPVYRGTYEQAEMAKIAVNTHLAMQVEFTNRMQAACAKVGAEWHMISDAIRHDKRIGHNAYLTPGNWKDSIHLLRDSVTLKEIEDA